MKIEIETTKRYLDYEIFNAKNLSLDTCFLLSDGSIISWDGAQLKKRADESYIFYLAVQIITSVGTNLFSSWLFEKLKNHEVKIRIEGNEIRNNPEEIQKALIGQSERENAKPSDII